MRSSNQDSKNNLATLICGKWVPERFLQLFFFYEYDRNLHLYFTFLRKMAGKKCEISS